MRIFKIAERKRTLKSIPKANDTQSGNDWEVSLECVCADDFGAYYSNEQSDENSQDAERYEETKAAHARLKELADERGIRNYVADTDDQNSKHSDACLYFSWSRLKDVLEILAESGVSGDILDIPKDFPVDYEKQVAELGWNLERH